MNLVLKIKAIEKQVQELEAELERRTAWLNAELQKYEPSDGVMMQLLALNECIREAAKLMEMFQQLLLDRVLPGHKGPLLGGTMRWLGLPVVKAARGEKT